MSRRLAAIGVIATVILTAPAAGGDLEVVSVSPGARDVSAATDVISVTFDAPLDRSSITPESFWAFGRWSGTVQANQVLSGDGRTANLVVTSPLSAGEQVMVILSHDIRAADGRFLRPGGYSFQFWTAARPSSMDFEEIQSLTTEMGAGEDVRSYGGTAPDLDRDGYPDLVIVNEISQDVRVFMNRADGTGLFDPFLMPPTGVGAQASPSETGDFNRDGFPDVCVSNTAAASVSILLGAGDGTFMSAAQVPVADGPYGIAVLDKDGDGDMDIVTSNWIGDNMTVLENDGSGTFTVSGTFAASGDAERWVCAADMDEDGIMDLVIGAQDSQEVIIRRGAGDGTFPFVSSTPCGGGIRVLNCADLDGDGHDDVVTANGLSNNAGVMFGNGDGTLQPVQIYQMDPFTGSTDLADLDGDGDLDWSVSNFLGDWLIFRNDGRGQFTFEDSFSAPQVASCSILVDFDRDGDVDIVLVDELADRIFMRRNAGTPGIPGDADGDGDVDVDDLIAVLVALGPCQGCPEDFNGDGVVDIDDLLAVLANWS